MSLHPSILVTGGAGYIGSHACKALAAAGFGPVCYDNLCMGHREAVRWGPLIEADLADRARLEAALREYDVQAVMHFAAHAYVGESVRNPGKYLRDNALYTLNVLDAMLVSGIKPLVFSSTCATYGTPERVPIGEDHPQRPVNPYGDSKLYAEKALRWYGEAHGLRWAALRYFNAAGADPDGEIGEEHAPETHLIPLVLQAALGQRPAIEVYGNDYPTPDGTAVRDYIHVADLAEAHVRALRRLLDGASGLALNLGTGRGWSVREVIQAAKRITGRDFPVRESGRRAGDPPALVADAAKARATLEWAPRLSDLDTIVRTAWDWHRNRIGSPPA